MCQVVVVVWQLRCRGSYHFLKHDCVADVVPLYQYTHWNWYSFGRPRKDDRLSQPLGVLIQRPTGLELRTLGSQATTLTTEETPGSMCQSVNVLVRGGQHMLKGGLSSPCILLSIASVGVVGSAEQNREHITHLTGFLSEHLGVPTDRIVMRFQPLEPWQVGKDGKLLVDL
uniref:D-dopachrome decarboxylase n=1 Tax=Eptatretus burgeri TaxID=7764 RepID=A0A8C4Q1V4_EPTBU